MALLRALLDLPPQASTYAASIDLLHLFVIGTTMLGATFVFALALWFLVQNRRRAKGELTPEVRASVPAEMTTIGLLLTVFIVFWIIGASQYDRMMTPPPGAIPVYVTAKQWMWKFSYADGRTSMDVLTVPVNRPVKLVMTSRDVIHSFYVPAFRMERDVVPGRYYAAWFEANTPGSYDIRCAEYCGVSHSRMLGSVRVLSAEDYGKWLASPNPGEVHDLVRDGMEVAAKRGCLSCHTLDGQSHIGPSWAGLYGSTVRLEDGRSVVADDGYLTKSMMEPAADVVAGFKPVMPTYRGVLEEPEVAALVELMASVKDKPISPSVTLPKVEPKTMTTIDAGLVPVPEERVAGRTDYLNAVKTVRSWALTTDHKRIGVLYLVSTILALGLGGSFALVLRTEHLTPGPTIISADTYDRMFTMHGIAMVWLFMIPSIPAAFGNFLLPIMVGAKDVAFPRLNLASYYIYLFGAIWVLVALWVGGVDTGWTFYTPYSAHSPSAVVPTVLGIFILGWSTIITGVNFIVTTHTMRARGMGWFRMPLFVWAMYGTSIIQVLATPVLAISVAIVGIDHWLDWGLFDPARGGDPVLYQHLFWFYSHPAVYIMILPAMGVISEIVPTFSHKNPYSYKAIAYSTLGIAFVGFLTWGHHMFVAGISVFDAGAFGVLSMLVAIFSAIKVFTWVLTMRKGSITVRTPLLYFFAFLFLFVFGGMTGVAVATESLDVHWHDTYFVVAHFHFIMVGGTLTAWLAAIHYWFPKITGRMYPERWGFLSAALIFAGFFMTFFPQFLLGNAGMPRRYYDYDPQFQPLMVISTVGAWILGAGMTFTLGYLIFSVFAGAKAPANPWDSRSYEWLTDSPPPPHNFNGEPVFEHGPYDYTEPSEGTIGARVAVTAPHVDREGSDRDG